jgi:hypothetical protein
MSTPLLLFGASKQPCIEADTVLPFEASSFPTEVGTDEVSVN